MKKMIAILIAAKASDFTLAKRFTRGKKINSGKKNQPMYSNTSIKHAHKYKINCGNN